VLQLRAIYEDAAYVLLGTGQPVLHDFLQRFETLPPKIYFLGS
jgi:hypothetical protein